MKIKSTELIADLIKSTKNLKEIVEEKFVHLSDSELNHKPNPDAWSITQCLEHLNLYGDYYLEAMENAMQKSNADSKTIFKSGMIGNYFANVMYQNNYPNILKPSLAFFVRTLEKLSPFWISHYFLAEKNYEKECPFVKNKFTVVANKFKSTSFPVNHISKNTKQKTLQFLITGTLSQPYGTLEGIEFIKKIHQIDTHVELHIVGYCMDKIYLRKIKKAIQNCKFISLIGGETAVAYIQIMNYTKKSDILLLPYLPNKSTQDCIPTKFYEAIAHRKVMLIQKNQYWQKLFKAYDVGVFIDFEQDKKMNKGHFEKLMNSLRTTDFYTQKIPKEFYLWEHEGKKMLNILLDL